MEGWALFAVAASAGVALILSWLVEESAHRRRISGVPIRVHVNGIRGKSSITRYIVAALRAGGLEVVGKTTGSATRLMMPDGHEVKVARVGAPTILEQIVLLKHAITPKTDAIVVECMALNPEYQLISETRMIRATDGIIANVRRDHVDILGHSLEEIAESLSATVPRDGILYTAVEDENLLGILKKKAVDPVKVIDPDSLSKEEMEALGPLTMPENIAIALAVAEHHGIDRKTAFDGMSQVEKDPGASVMKKLETEAGILHWINLFSINDVPSVEVVLSRILDDLPDKPVALMLNTRDDRTDRTADFIDWIETSHADKILIETGSDSRLAHKKLEHDGVETHGEFHVTATATCEDIVEQLLRIAGGTEAIVVGLANIHTDDAEHLISALEGGE